MFSFRKNLPVKTIPDQHVYYHQELDTPRINLEVEKNSRGFNWKAVVVNATSVDEAMAMLADAEARLRELYGEKIEVNQPSL